MSGPRERPPWPAVSGKSKPCATNCRNTESQPRRSSSEPTPNVFNWLCRSLTTRSVSWPRSTSTTWDGTVAAQKALSAAYRTGQRFGSHHLVDVLLGEETERVVRLRHNQLKTFGVGSELDRRGWLSVFRQLVAQGLLLPDMAGHGGFSLGPDTAAILRGTKTVQFRRDSRNAAQRRSERGRTTEPDLDPAARALWEALRAWRLQEARRQELPPYVIFHDSTLAEIARRRPGSLTALASISGVGGSKLERYGSAIIDLVAEKDPQGALDSASGMQSEEIR